MRVFKTDKKQKWWHIPVVFLGLWFIWQAMTLGMDTKVAYWSISEDKCVKVIEGDNCYDCDAFAKSTVENMERVWVK